ncbi:bifunctional proline dehydrogenase/L-glutamate gamma-semialdehyde dehydrogenase PutA [Leisingera aquaemixtae]|uniref:bifunctional proline dehydrogenase/L-glutamate gamma-semialdehyde dehydrogenase PutA n=1 Tax=Leisingera aquaemixtae TaxID=1396826 RepID=UPI0021A96F2A|nr:bifunctional proline dehydrogenase/L-glutamate gamma-semialdehyde dehydrogenase PutA [Leisingera aquaemixtae]UWQ38646.1 bifunctional proline dehydrogenase/L-glutamate gamma-semialdehyde dehydrogenase PutA [Leisingera aquaemixtae]
MTIQSKLRCQIDAGTYADQTAMRDRLVAQTALSDADRARICSSAAALVRDIRGHSAPGLMEVFLAEYGLSTEEGIALMCLAEALLRVPDADTIDALIEDKIAPSDWGKHLGKSTSSLVNASTWALMLTGKVLDEDRSPIGALRGAIKRLGEPVIRTAVSRAMKEMGRQFVLGETIESAMNRAAGMEAKGYTYSYDMLGEAARTEADASRYHLSYSKAISAIAAACNSDDIRKNPGISVKLSALHPRYELAQDASVMEHLVPRLKALALLAKAAKMGLNVDAEEADRLSLSLEVIDAVVSDPALAGWDGFGVVVQAYGPRAGLAIDALHEMAEKYNRRFMVRLVKGAYWDTEIKRAQVEGVDGFPVYTSKPLTDVSYISNARKLLGLTDRIYPQFATHNAHTVAAILHMAEGMDKGLYEFQRLHGMGETLHQMVLEQNKTNCRIYAPVGAHRDLLAYLVRRLLENGANSSFVNQIVDENVPPEVVAADPFDAVADVTRKIPTGPELYAPERPNSKGFDLGHAPTLAKIEEARAPWRSHQWQAAPLLAGDAQPEAAKDVTSPTDLSVTGTVSQCSPEDIELALALADPWDAPAEERAAILNKAADLYEENYGELFAILAREAGKTIPDAVAELREAVDFLRYYAARIPDAPPAGIFSCISPWNFPLAIFTGQVSAALAAGNAVLAKPADQTPLIAHRAVQLMHEAGVPRSALQLVPGRGSVVGAAITSDPRVNGVAFTGSTATALRIRKAMADNLQPGAPLIAETGGLNAMIVDSTALPEQAVQAVIESAFQSAGQRCSALRCLYLQDDIAETVLKMLKGAMDCLRLDDPWHLSTDSGPVIDEGARAGILAHIDKARAEGRVMKELMAPQGGTFVAPTMIEVPGISALEEEIFGPVLHVARFKSHQLDQVISDINATGYGLTFGLHTRIDDRVQHVCDRVHAGNIYVNRNQIGAIVGSQPFGGEGLSGTGPKAGGPFYLNRFCAPDRQQVSAEWDTETARLPGASGVPVQPVTTSLPGPTGESNRLTVSARPPLLCMGPGPEAAAEQAKQVISLGGTAIEAHGLLGLNQLQTIEGISGVLWWGDEATGRDIEQCLARRDGPIIPLIPGKPDRARVLAERHVCVDTTASGGNAQLLGGNA